MNRPYTDVADLDYGTAAFARIEELLRTDSGVLLLKERQAMTKFFFRKRCGLLKDDDCTIVIPDNIPAIAEAYSRLAFDTPEFALLTEAEQDARREENRAIGKAEYGKRREAVNAARDAEYAERTAWATPDLEHSAQEKTWSDAEWAALVHVFNAEQEWADLPPVSSLKRSSLWDRLRITFSRQHKYAEGEDAAHRSEATHLQLDLNAVLSKWSGTEVKTRKVGAAVQLREGLAEGATLDYNSFQAQRRAELTADASFSPTKLKAGVKPRSRHAAADWEEGASPSTRKAYIDARLSADWAAFKVAQGISEPKHYQPLEFFTRPFADGALWKAVAKQSAQDNAADGAAFTAE